MWLARLLLHLLEPDPRGDPFVPRWYRAVAAHLHAKGNFGPLRYHVEHGLALLPRDPVLLFHAGATHEFRASPYVQHLKYGPVGNQLRIQAADTHWREAERLFRQFVDGNGPPEAGLRLAHVLTRLGRHREAAAALARAAGRFHSRRLEYLRALLLGSAQVESGRPDAGRESFERATTLFPTAQAPLVCRVDLGWRTGDRAVALDALRRLQALPELRQRRDPWWEYYRYRGEDSEAQMAALRGSLLPEKHR